MRSPVHGIANYPSEICLLAKVPAEGLFGKDSEAINTLFFLIGMCMCRKRAEGIVRENLVFSALISFKTSRGDKTKYREKVLIAYLIRPPSTAHMALMALPFL